jgi:hypothetical protein
VQVPLAVDLFTEAIQLQQFLSSRAWSFTFVGGLALQYWADPRIPRAIDVALLAGFGRESEFVDPLLSVYAPRIPDAREFALARRVLLLRTAAGTAIDVSLAALAFEAHMIERAVTVEPLPGHTLRICSPEDLIVMKLFAAREADVREARSVAVRRRAGPLDWPYIDEHVRALAELKDDPHMLRLLDYIRESVRP